VDIAWVDNTGHRILGSVSARNSDHSNPGISIHIFPPNTAHKTLCRRPLGDSRKDNGLLGSPLPCSRFALSSLLRVGGENFPLGLLLLSTLVPALAE
jgi:hypothetical protein